MLQNCCGFVVKSCEIVAIFTPNCAKLLRLLALKKSEGARKVAVFAHILCDFGSQPTGSPGDARGKKFLRAFSLRVTTNFVSKKKKLGK